MAKTNKHKMKPKMEPSPATAPKHRSFFNKLKNPTHFSKPQLLVFVLAFALIGYLLVKAFAAAPVVATIEGEQMTPQLASASSANSRLSQTGPSQVVLASSTKYANITLPALSGSATVGSTLTVTNGTWNPIPRNYKYAWWRCDSSGNNCTHSPTSASKNTYALQSGDVGFTIRAQVAPNGAWSYSKSSPTSAVVTVPVAAGGSFTNLTKPTLSGSTTVGSTLTAGNGSWNPVPSSYRYAWWRCDSSGNNCSHSPTATDSTLKTYALQSGDTGFTIMVQVAPNGVWTNSASSPPSAVITSPINYSVVTDSSASGGKAAKFGGGVKITGSVTLAAAGVSFTVSARADQCGSSWPQMVVAVDGTSRLNSSVNSTTWNSYSASVSLASGSHSLTITNTGGSSCNLYVDATNFYGAAPAPTPAPTVALSTSPTSVTSGQSSTLTWASTNATACTASGAWSGSKPTSGSVSTGAINQSSTYSLTCTGTGGTATASATVAVSSTASGGTPGIGVLAYGGNLKYVLNLNGYSMVIGSSYSSDSPLLQSTAGRGLTYFAGSDVNTTYSTGVPSSQASANGWLLYCGTILCTNKGFANDYIGDIGSSGYQQAFITNVENYLAAHPGTDGIFIDDVLYTATGLIGSYPNKYPSLSTWSSAQVSFVKAVYSALHSKGYYVALNASGYVPGDANSNTSANEQTFWKMVGPYSDGLMSEWYDETASGITTAQLRSTGTAWYQQWDSWQQTIPLIQSMGKDFIGLTKQTCTNTTAMTYGKASFLLEWNGGGGAYIYTCGGSTDPTNTAWTKDIGKPSAAKVQVGVGWERTYTKGTVLVNPSPTASQTFTVNGTSYTLSPTTARIL
jgi:hypothetical protein